MKSNKFYNNIYFKNIVFIIIFSFVNLNLLLHGDLSFFNVMLIWNIILAFLPVVFSKKSLILFEENKKISPMFVLMVFLWLIFLPNSFYVVTDIIHLSNLDFYKTISSSEYGKYLTIYSNNISHWINLLTLTIGVIYSVFCGFISERFIEKSVFQLLKFKNKVFAIIVFRFLISFIASIGIYIGRFLRLNSWDIFNIPKYIAQFNIVGHNLTFIIAFIISFTLFIFTILNLNYIFANNTNNIK